MPIKSNINNYILKREFIRKNFIKHSNSRISKLKSKVSVKNIYLRRYKKKKFLSYLRQFIYFQKLYLKNINLKDSFNYIFSYAKPFFYAKMVLILYNVILINI